MTLSSREKFDFEAAKVLKIIFSLEEYHKHKKISDDNDSYIFFRSK